MSIKFKNCNFGQGISTGGRMLTPEELNGNDVEIIDGVAFINGATVDEYRKAKRKEAGGDVDQ